MPALCHFIRPEVVTVCSASDVVVASEVCTCEAVVSTADDSVSEVCIESPEKANNPPVPIVRARTPAAPMSLYILLTDGFLRFFLSISITLPFRRLLQAVCGCIASPVVY